MTDTKKTTKKVIKKDIKCVCIKNITTKAGYFVKNSELELNETEFKHFEKSKAVKKI